MSIQIVRQALASVLGKEFFKNSCTAIVFSNSVRLSIEGRVSPFRTLTQTPTLFLLGTVMVTAYNDSPEPYKAFLESKGITVQLLADLGAKLECFYVKNYTEKQDAVKIYATVDVLAILAKQAEEVAQIQEAAELEEAILENETETVALPENITFAQTNNPEDQQFWKPDYYGRKPYNNGYITYIWGSYRYGAKCREGLVYCGEAVIAEGVESAQDAYELCTEHFANWEWETIYKAPTHTETLAKEIFNDTLAQSPLIQQDFGQNACALPQPKAETAPAETVGNPETTQTDPYLAERPIDETITANEFYSYADPETLTDEQICGLFQYGHTPDGDVSYYGICVGKTEYCLSVWDSGDCLLHINGDFATEWGAEISNLADKNDRTVIRAAYQIIYKDLCQISPFAPRETIINLESDKGLSDMQVREIEKSLLIGINKAENFIIYNARAEYDTKAGRWLCIGKDHKTGKKLQGYIDACKIVQPYKQTL